jgi:glycerol-3-phosphate dehydrogenase
MNAVDKLRDLIPELKPSQTATTSLPGNDDCSNNVVDYLQQFRAAYPWLPEKLAQRLAKNYGTRAKLILQNCTQLSDLGIEFGAGLYTKEVEYLITQEWAKTVEDILWRRTKLGLKFTPEQIKQLEQWLQAHSLH